MKDIFLSIICAVLTGCTALPPAVSSSKPVDQVAAMVIGEKIVGAIVNGNYREFARYTGETVDIKSQNDFEQSRWQIEKSMGNFNSWRYLGTLQTPLLVNQIYAVKFVRKGSYGQKVEHEQLLQLIIGYQDQQYKLVGMRFI